MLNVFLYTVTTLFLLLSVLLIMIVLIQKGRGGGLASAFGGAGGHTAFGSKTGDVLTWATSIIFGVFLILAVAANLIFERVNVQIYGETTTVAPTKSAPGSPTSTLPHAPVTADPGVANPPTPADSNGPTTLPANTNLRSGGATTRP